MAAVLVSWGVSPRDATQIIREHDTNGDGRLSFEEFYNNMPVVWKFGAQIARQNAVEEDTKDS
jgi:hypothetical protein